ncbi:unnamed protein product [Aphanomyces euteiches]
MKAPDGERDRRFVNGPSELLQDETDSRSERILTELAALCLDRDYVLSTESLQVLSTTGKAECVKLTPEKVSSTSSKKDDARISSDAARRQRVEELTRFFMEAKSDIEFALSGGSHRRERPSTRDLELNEEDRDMMDSDSSSIPADDKPDEVVAPPPPPPPTETPPSIPLHFQLLEDPVDPRVFHPLLSSIRETDPVLYGTIVCHPLVTGQEPAKKAVDKRSKKKKKTPSSSKKPETSMYQPDFSLAPLSAEETALNLARFIARAVADRSIQALLLVIKVVSSYPWSSLQIPVRSHLQLLSGHAAPTPPPQTKEEKSPTEASMDFMSSVMELEGQLDPLAALRSRLGRFEEKNAMEEEEERLVDQMSLNIPMDEGVDEEVLMARAIALSLSPEVGLKEPPSAEQQPPPLEEKAIPAKFSPEEVWSLFDPIPDLVDGAMIVQYCIGAILVECKSYLKSCERSVLPANCPIVPHPLTFLLLHSNLAHVAPPTSDFEHVVISCSQLILLHALELHLFHVDVVALPDLALPFVPLRTPELTRVDDSMLQTVSKPFLSCAPVTLRDALTSGECTLQAVAEYCQLVAPERTPLSAADLHLENVMELYQQVYDKEQAAVQQIWNQLPPLVDALLRRVHEPAVNLPSAYSHAPLVASSPDNPRLLLLRSLQDGMFHVSGVEVATALEFDPTRCAETLTLVENNQSAKQHTAKQWGMVISTYACAPNTGLHEWAVRLDRCEKGHVFLGVCAREASVSTYVGGDRLGWGLIGTRALWHNRSKVRGDYGDGFSTGSTVRIRLNTDTGALSFGLLDEDSDWGVAFDGLTQYGTLYPAIGLYQRDDQVTIVPVQPKKSTSTEASIPSTPAMAMDKDLMFQTFLNYANKVLNIEQLSVPLLSALAQMKSQWRTQFAWHLLPACMELAKRLDKELTGQLQLEIEGTWELRSCAAGSIPAQQYVLQLVQDEDGSLTGQSVSNNAVSLKGAIRGTRVSFLETWIQGGTCLVTGRVRIDGKKFLGTYEDTRSHTCGSISGESTVSTGSTAKTVHMRSVLHLVVTTLIGAYVSCFLNHEIHSPTELVDEEESSPDASLEEYDEWINSRLFAGGLPTSEINRYLQGYILNFQPLPWFQVVLPSLGSPEAEEQNSFIHDLIAGRNDVDSYVTKHAGESAFVRLGGDAMKVAKRTVIAAMLWHTQIEAIDTSHEDVRPGENILHVWRTAHRVIEWGVRTKNSNSMSYAGIANLITRRARFLLKLEPIRGQVLPERVFSEILMLVSRFIESSAQLKRLETMILQNCSRAYLRMVGFNCMRVVLEAGFQKSSGLCAILQWLTLDSLDDISSTARHGHYLDGLGAVGTVLHRQVRESWEQLYGHLGALLSRSTWAKDYELQLIALQAWGVIINPEDHAFISRVGIFRILQTVLDEARSTENPAPKHIVQATLKVVHLLAAQVATSSHEEVTVIDTNSAIPLVRQPSGPETLGKSVFNMLYTELNNACQEEMGPQQYCYQICSLLFSLQAPDDECMGIEDDSSRNAPQLISFFLDLLGHVVPHVNGDTPAKSPSLVLHHGCGLEVVLLLRSLLCSDDWSKILQEVFMRSLSELKDNLGFEQQTRALSVLCVMGGHIEGLQVGMSVQIVPRSSSPSQEVMFRGAKGVLVALDVDKVAAEVLLQKNGAGTSELTLSTHRPIRVPLEDIVALPDVEVKPSDISQDVIVLLVEGSLPRFLSSILSEEGELLDLMISLVGFRALGSLIQHGDLLDSLRASIPALFKVATIQTQCMSDVGILEEQWVQMYKKWYDVQCPSPDKEGGDAASAVLTPPSAMCQQMMEMGFPREW